MASELELRHNPALPRGAAEAIPGRLALALIQPHSTASDDLRPDASSLASVAAGAGFDRRTTAETTSAGAA
jgi:hypothetical protein